MSHDSTKLKIGIIDSVNQPENQPENQFEKLLNEYILDSVKIFKNFSTEINKIKLTDCHDYNYIFYLTTIGELNPLRESGIPSEISKISSCVNFQHQRNHLFVIVDECDELEFDDDGDLVFCSDEENKWFCDLDRELSVTMSEDVFDLCKISVEQSLIWKSIHNEKSIVNLTDGQIDKLAQKLLKKSNKLSLSEKKKDIKLALKKLDINDKIGETGYTEFFEIISQYFKLPHQKCFVTQNYLYSLGDILNKIINVDHEKISDLKLIIDEIYSITYLKKGNT